MRCKFLFLLVFVFLVGCGDYTGMAPVSDINTHKVGKVRYHLVQPGETLYAVAWRYEKDYRTLAQLNNLRPPYAIHSGDLIRLNGKVKKVSAKKVPAKIVGKVKTWAWPTQQHRISCGFSCNNKGIDIAGNANTPIFAAAAGRVVYAGSGIRGYGNLLIIKHNAVYLTAYAYNSKLLVRQGQVVRARQKIALMGMNSNLDQAGLHFEIRRAGRAVDPLGYLK